MLVQITLDLNNPKDAETFKLLNAVPAKQAPAPVVEVSTTEEKPEGTTRKRAGKRDEVIVTTPAPAAAPAPAPEPKVDAPTEEQIKDLIKKYSDRHGLAKFKEKLNETGAKRVSELAPADLRAFYDARSAELSAESAESIL